MVLDNAHEDDERFKHSPLEPSEELLAAWSSPEANVNVAELDSASKRLQLKTYFSQLWKRRHFIRAYSSGRAHGSIKGTVLGRLWLLLDPFLTALVFFVIFGVLLNFSRGIDNFIGYLVVGTTMFTLINSHFTRAANILVSGQNLSKAFAFPRTALVISFLRQQLIDFFPSFITLLIFLVVVAGVIPSITWPLAIVGLFLAIVFCLGISFLVATFTYLVPDLKFVWPILSRFWLYGSGIFWSINQFDNRPGFQQIVELNPAWVVLEVTRQTLIYDSVPKLSYYLYLAAWAFGLLIVGFFVFWRNEEKFGMNHER